MQLEIVITSQPIAPHREPPVECRGRVGACAEFIGLVREDENGRAIAALEYEAYAPMAERVVRGIVEDIARRHPCDWVRVAHRVGVIPVGEAAVVVEAAARHRAAAFAMLAEFMDRLKQDVPIWKCRALTAVGLASVKSS